MTEAYLYHRKHFRPKCKKQRRRGWWKQDQIASSWPAGHACACNATTGCDRLAMRTFTRTHIHAHARPSLCYGCDCKAILFISLPQLVITRRALGLGKIIIIIIYEILKLKIVDCYEDCSEQKWRYWLAQSTKITYNCSVLTGIIIIIYEWEG